MNTEERAAMFGELAFLIDMAQCELAKAEASDGCNDCAQDYFDDARRALAQAAMIVEGQFGEELTETEVKGLS